MTFPELIFNPSNRALGGFMRNSAPLYSFRGGYGGHSGEGNIITFYKEEEIAESAQNYCYRDYILVTMWLI